MPARPDRCSICGKPVTPKFAPFCSQLCRDRDLIAWIDERYRVPARNDEDDDRED